MVVSWITTAYRNIHLFQHFGQNMQPPSPHIPPKQWNRVTILHDALTQKNASLAKPAMKP
jgi:hypothetical protein